MPFDKDKTAAFRVPLDDITVARLMELADICHAEPAVIIASIVRDVLEDDAEAHPHAPDGITLQ